MLLSVSCRLQLRTCSYYIIAGWQDDYYWCRLFIPYCLLCHLTPIISRPFQLWWWRWCCCYAEWKSWGRPRRHGSGSAVSASQSVAVPEGRLARLGWSLFLGCWGLLPWVLEGAKWEVLSNYCYKPPHSPNSSEDPEMLCSKVEGYDLASRMWKAGDIQESWIRIYCCRLQAESMTAGYCSSYLTYLQMIINAVQTLQRLASSCLITVQTG